MSFWIVEYDLKGRVPKIYKVHALLIVDEKALSLTDQLQLIDQSRTFAPLVDHEEDITDIDTDTTLQFRLKSDIATHRLPVTIEGKTDQACVLVEDRAT